MIRTWVEPGFEPVIIIIILIVVIAIIVIIQIIIVMIIIIISSSLGFRVGRACVPGLKKSGGSRGGAARPAGGLGAGGAPPICKC